MIQFFIEKNPEGSFIMVDIKGEELVLCEMTKKNLEQLETAINNELISIHGLQRRWDFDK